MASVCGVSAVGKVTPRQAKVQPTFSPSVGLKSSKAFSVFASSPRVDGAFARIALRCRPSRGGGALDARCDITSEVPVVADDSLLVVGPGVLGSMVGQQWLKAYPGSKVFGRTRTNARHAELESAGIIPQLESAYVDAASPQDKFPFVIFCAPPSGNADYVGCVRQAALSWSGEGSFLFTSSSGLYDVSDNGMCREGECPSVPLGLSPRLDGLLGAEAAALAAGGNVVRLAGLYTEERGAHSYWLRMGKVDSRPDHILNLISYEDAASLCVAILAARTRGDTFMGCDDYPLTREELMDVTVRSGRFSGAFHGFTGVSGPLGKRMDNWRTRETLGWAPRYGSFEEYLHTRP